MKLTRELANVIHRCEESPMLSTRLVFNGELFNKDVLRRVRILSSMGYMEIKEAGDRYIIPSPTPEGLAAADRFMLHHQDHEAS